MTKNDLKQIQDSVKVVVRPVLDIAEVLKQKISAQGFMVTTVTTNIRNMREQQSVMNEKITNMQKVLDKHTEKIDTIWDQTAHLTEEVAEIQETLNTHTTYLKQITATGEKNSDNINKLNQRLYPVEDQLGIVPPPEFTVV